MEKWETLKAFFRGLLRHPGLLCPLILLKVSSIHFRCPSSCFCYFLYFSENFPSASRLEKICTYSLSHAHCTSFYLYYILLLIHITPAFAAALIFPTAQKLHLCSYYENLIRLAGSTDCTIIISKERYEKSVSNSVFIWHLCMSGQGSVHLLVVEITLNITLICWNTSCPY